MGLRSVEQIASDRLLMLWLVSEVGPLDRFQLQKLPFREEWELNSREQRLFSYEFFQYDKGPISVNIYDDLDALKDLRLISEDRGSITASAEGKDLLSAFDGVLRNNASLLKEALEIIKPLSEMRSYQLVRQTHDMIVVFGDKEYKLVDVPPFTRFLPRPKRTSFGVDNHSLETLIILTNSELMQDIRRVRREGSSSSAYIPLVSA